MSISSINLFESNNPASGGDHEALGGRARRTRSRGPRWPREGTGRGAGRSGRTVTVPSTPDARSVGRLLPWSAQVRREARGARSALNRQADAPAPGDAN